MGYLRTYLMKAAANMIPLFLILTFIADVNWLTAIILSVVLTVLAFFVGDILVLPKTGNIIASLADGALVVLFFWVVNYAQLAVINNADIIYATAAVILVEGLFYHPYLKRLVTMDSMGPNFGKGN